jgi:3-oxoacyl-[acyl-carrier-protein] synthase-3
MAFSQFTNLTIRAVSTAFPENKVQNPPGDEIPYTRKALERQTAADLGFKAAQEIFSAKNINSADIGIIVFASKTPDYRSPATAIILQHRLNIGTDCLAYDINIGGAGFHYGLQVIASLLSSTSKLLALLVVGDTTNKQLQTESVLLHEFSDACSAMILEKAYTPNLFQVQTFSFGEGYKSFMIKKGGYRNKNITDKTYFWKVEDLSENNHILVDQAQFSKYVLDKIPSTLSSFLELSKTTISAFDYILLPQENRALLNTLARFFDIEIDSLLYDQPKIGWLFGAAIPLLLNEVSKVSNKPKLRILSASFGEGFSWGFSDFTIEKGAILGIISTDEFFNQGSVSHEM